MSGQAAVTIKGKTWTVGLALTPAELTQGLGGLASMPAGTGMLFDMGSERIITVTTMPMLFPIDIVFLDANLRVTDMALSEAPGFVLASDIPARYFLEVNAGEMAAAGVEAGDQAAVTVAQQPTAQQAGLDIGAVMATVIEASMLAWGLMAMVKELFPTREEVFKVMPTGKELKEYGRAVIPTRQELRSLLPDTRDVTGKRKACSVQVRAMFEKAAESFFTLVDDPELTGKAEGQALAALRDCMGIKLTPRAFETTSGPPTIYFHLYWAGQLIRKGDIAEARSEIGYMKMFYAPEQKGRGLFKYYSDRLFSRLAGHVDAAEDYLAKGRSSDALRELKAAEDIEYDFFIEHFGQEGFDYSPQTMPPEERETARPAVLQAAQTMPVKSKSGGMDMAEMHRRMTGGQGRGGMDYLADSPEWVALTIDDIGYRDRLDCAFQEGIRRAKSAG